jgi:hypothetical protein
MTVPRGCLEQLGDGDGEQAEDGGVAVTGALPGGCGGEESACKQADRGPAVPGGPGGDLAVVQAGDLLVQLVILSVSRRATAAAISLASGTCRGLKHW